MHLLHNGVAAIGRTLDGALGVLPFLEVFATQRFTAPIPCDRSLIGSTVELQGVDIGAFGGCGASSTGVQLVMADTLVIRFQ